MNIVKKLNIQTSRLIIRAFSESDLLESFELMQNQELFKYLDWNVNSFEGYKGLFKWWIDLYEMSDEKDYKYNFAIFLKENGKLIGWCGIGVIDCFYPEKEVYYLVGKEYWGYGYATEAVKALIEYFFRKMNLQRIIALTKPKNIASNRVIQKIGFKLDYIVEGLSEEYDFYNGEPYYSLTKDEFSQEI